ncbi:hypothetical protein OOZ15_18090 [Galbibacter sp. EGI 63066]|nr:hypothetical protein [Galbibacter sp. EGI 63066]
MMISILLFTSILHQKTQWVYIFCHNDNHNEQSYCDPIIFNNNKRHKKNKKIHTLPIASDKKALNHLYKNVLSYNICGFFFRGFCKNFIMKKIHFLIKKIFIFPLVLIGKAMSLSVISLCLLTMVLFFYDFLEEFTIDIFIILFIVSSFIFTFAIYAENKDAKTQSHLK